MDPLPFLAIAVLIFGSMQVAAAIAWHAARKQPLRGIGEVNAREYIQDKKPNTKRKI